MKRLRPMHNGFFTMESLVGLLILGVILSWIITFVLKSGTLVEDDRHQDIAKSHAEFVLSQIRNAPIETLPNDIRQGVWNYPNAPTITALGLMALPGESIITESAVDGALKVKVIVRWVDRHGEAQEETVRMVIGE